jgi:hypothetical protein
VLHQPERTKQHGQFVLKFVECTWQRSKRLKVASWILHGDGRANREVAASQPLGKRDDVGLGTQGSQERKGLVRPHPDLHFVADRVAVLSRNCWASGKKLLAGNALRA